MPRPVLVALLVLVACARDNRLLDRDGGLDFVIGGIELRVSSGTALERGGELAFYLTDQPDACLAVTQVTAGVATILELRVAPQADGTTSAVVAPGGSTPGPGQAAGELATRSAGVE